MSVSPGGKTGHARGRTSWAIGLLGLGVGWTCTLPGFRPAGVPIGYLLVLMAGVALGRVDRRVVACFFPMLVASLYAFAVGSLWRPDGQVNLVVRNLVGLGMAVLVGSHLRTWRDVRRFLVCAAPFVVAGEVFAIAQYFGSEGAIRAPFEWGVVERDRITEVAAIEFHRLRVFGFQGFPHVFAYAESLWAAALMASLVLGARSHVDRRVIGAWSFVSGVCVVLSAQRSAVVALVFVAVAMFGMGGEHRLGKRLKQAIGQTVAIVVIGAVISVAGAENRTLVRLVDFESAMSSDRLRLETWRAAVSCIEEDPFFGSAYNEEQLEAGIHNGLLSGWAQFGIGWLSLIVWGVIRWVTVVRRAASTGKAALVSCCVAVPVAANVLTHTLCPGLNDLLCWPFLGWAVVLARMSGSESEGGDASIRTSFLPERDVTDSE